MGGDSALETFGFKELEHLHELAEEEDLLALRDERVEQFEQGLGFAGEGVAADEFGMAADLAQAGEGGQDMDFALVEALFQHGAHHLLAAAAQLGQVKLALLVAERAIAALLDALGQIFGDMFLEAAQKEGTEFG